MKSETEQSRSIVMIAGLRNSTWRSRIDGGALDVHAPFETFRDSLSDLIGKVLVNLRGYSRRFLSRATLYYAVPRRSR